MLWSVTITEPFTSLSKIFHENKRSFLAIGLFTGQSERQSHRARGEVVLGLVGVELEDEVCFGGAKSKRA